MAMKDRSAYCFCQWKRTWLSKRRKWDGEIREGWGGEQCLGRESMKKLWREMSGGEGLFCLNETIWAPCVVSWKEGEGPQRPPDNPRSICETKVWFCLVYLSRDFSSRPQPALLTSKECAWNVLSRDTSHPNNASWNDLFFFFSLSMELLSVVV